MSYMTLESLTESAMALARGIARRPVWIEQIAARELAPLAARTAPIWRWVRIAGPMSDVVVRGTSGVATLGGAGSLALTAGVPIVVAAGVWVMLGSGYYQARQIARKNGVLTGFAQGFTMGILNWKWEQAVSRFGKRFVVNPNTFDPQASKEEAMGYNEGLVAGYAAGYASSDDMKKAFRITLRKLAGRTDSGDWSRNSDVAYQQQTSYVIQLSGAGRGKGLFVQE